MANKPAFRQNRRQAPKNKHVHVPVRTVREPREETGRIITERKTLEVPGVLTVREFADALKLPVTEVIGKLMRNGVMANINESIDLDTMTVIGDELGYDITLKGDEENVGVEQHFERKNLIERSPVVTVMGHVDHGKTKLLDAIRHTNVIAGESGGITQHIGAYQVRVPSPEDASKERTITFLDTPGHEAFSAMRAHGANITDVVVLVVAANDGVKPQTIEAANHAKAAGVPVVVAINKIDLQDADLDRVKRQLADIDLLPEEWGGQTPMIGVSAKDGTNIEDLLEMVLLVADLKELKADPTVPASGVVIESHMQAGRGPIATVLVQEGTLHVGDPIIIGQTYGKIRIMENYFAKKINEAKPSEPVLIAGLQDIPNFGDRFLVVDNEKAAKDLTKTKTIKRRVLSIGELSQEIKEGKIKELKVVLKADVAGSLEAIHESFKNLSNEEVTINVIHEGVGDVSESDVNMAVASHALVIGFRVKVPADVINLARREKIKIQIYEIIYQLLDDLQAALSGLLEPEIVEVEIGRLQILGVFKTTRNEQIIGGRVTSGKLENGGLVRITRNKEVVGEGKITSLQQNKRDVSEVLENFECGLRVETSVKIQVGDSIECYRKEERIRKLGQ